MKKVFVLDTNVLIHDPQSIYRFSDNIVVIPLVVIEEIDKFKRDISEKGRHARMVSRELDKLRAQGNLTDGVKINERKGLLKIVKIDNSIYNILPFYEEKSSDNLIISVALYFKQKYKKHKIVFVTKDINSRIKADSLGLRSVDYEREKIDIEELYSGVNEVPVTDKEIKTFFDSKILKLKNDKNLYSNQYLLLRNESRPNQTALGRYISENGEIIHLINKKEGVWGIFPKNKEQRFAFDMLLDDKIKLVTLVGKAGTGKTLLALAAGLYKTTDEGAYIKLLVSRPIFPLGKELGFLPGTLEEKLKPWMQPIFDNVELLLGMHGKDGGHKDKKRSINYRDLEEQGILEIEALTYIRGRSIPNQFIIVDEAQNLTPHEIKTIITRVGENTKIVLTGDPYQIDNPYIDSSSNGLTYTVEKFKESSMAGHITLIKGERSSLADLAANLL